MAFSFSEDELDQLYAVHVFANTPAYLYKHWRKLISTRSDVGNISRNDLETLAAKGAGDDRMFFKRLALCCSAFLRDNYLLTLENAADKDPWWSRLFALAKYDFEGNSSPETVYKSNIYMLGSPTPSVANNRTIILTQ